LFHLLKRVFIDGDKIETMSNAIFLENTTNLFSGTSAFTDLVIDNNGIKTNYEVHCIDDEDTIKRKRYCSELNGYEFVLEDITLYTYPNGKYIDQLR